MEIICVFLQAMAVLTFIRRYGLSCYSTPNSALYSYCHPELVSG
jgi:hypothetical protein